MFKAFQGETPGPPLGWEVSSLPVGYTCFEEIRGICDMAQGDPAASNIEGHLII